MIDPNDKTWGLIKAHIEAQTRDAIAALKRRDVSHDESQWLRGRITELESMLALAPEKKQADPGINVPTY